MSAWYDNECSKDTVGLGNLQADHICSTNLSSESLHYNPYVFSSMKYVYPILYMFHVNKCILSIEL